MLKAAKEWAKTDKHTEHARVLEVLGDYSGTVAAYVKGNEFEIALKRAVQFEKQRIQLKPAVTSQQIASDYIRKLKLSQDADKTVLKNLLMSYVSDGVVKADFLKEIGLYDEAITELLNEKQLKEAYRVMKAQNRFIQGVDKAQDQETKYTFQLLCLKEEMSPSNRFISSLLECRIAIIRGYAELLYAVTKNDISYFRKAMKSFESCTCVPGIVISYQSRFLLNSNCKKDIVEVFNMSSLANQVKTAITAVTKHEATLKQKNIFKDVLKLHDMEEGENCYYIPEVSLDSSFRVMGLNLNSAQFSKDADGMIMLEKQKTDEQMVAFYSQIVHTWLSEKDVYDHVLNLAKRLNSFSFHRELYQQCFKQTHYTQSALLKYFEHLTNVLHFHSLCPTHELQDLENIKAAAQTLFSFHTFFYLPINREFIDSLHKNSFIKEYFLEIAKNIINQDDVTLDHYFISWSLFMIFSSSVHVLRSHLEAKVSENCDLVLKYKRKTHVFFWWTYAWTTLVVYGKVTAACKTILFQLLFRLPEINRDIMSISNITYVLSVFSSLLMTVMNLNVISPTFVFPLAFRFFCDTFSCIKGSRHQRIDIIQSCVMESITNDEPIHLLLDMMQFLVHKRILQKSLSSDSSISDGSALNCLILCLVLVSNIYHYSYKNNISTANPQEMLLSIQRELHYYRKHSDKKVTFVEEAYSGLQLARNLEDVLKVIVTLLDFCKQSTDLVCPNAMMNFDGTVTVVFLHVYTKVFSEFKIRSLVIIESDEEIPEHTVNAPELPTLHSTDTNEHEEVDVEDKEHLPSQDERLIQDDFCSVCGVEVFELDHLITKAHKNKFNEFMKWKEEKEKTESANTSLVETIQKFMKETNLIDYESIMKKSQSSYNSMMSEMDNYQRDCDWKMCQEILKRYKNMADNYLKRVHKIKEENEDFSEHEEDEETTSLSADLPKATITWTKRKKR